MSVKGISVPSAGGAFVKRSQVPPVSMPRSVVDLSRGHKTSMDAGLVVPLLVEEILPGDTMQVRATVLARLSTLLYPLMDNLYMDLHYFFVPWRLVWANTRKFFGEQDNPADSISYLIPEISALLITLNPKNLADYMGINPYLSGQQRWNALQVRGYKRIWNEHYRDQNLQNSVPYSTGDGPDTLNNAYVEVLPRNKRGDRFTLALPWPQKGALPVSFLPNSVQVEGTGAAPLFDQVSGATPKTNFRLITGAATSVIYGSGGNATTVGDIAFRADTLAGLKVDFEDLGIATINGFRQAYAMQVYLERNARHGTRYPEYLKGQWGVTSSDARLQRTEYLGGSSAPLVVSAVTQQSAKDPGVNSLGDLGGVGVIAHHGGGIVKSFEEHGYLYCMASIRADLNYQHGLPRQFSRRTVFDVANPAFANIGEQPILNKEIWYDGEGVGNPNGVFGYEERFAEYKSSYSILTGNMRSLATDSYDVWHVAQEFAVQPTLGDTFIRENPAVDRTIATPFVDQFIIDAYFNIRAARVLPLWGVPGLAGRF